LCSFSFDLFLMFCQSFSLFLSLSLTLMLTHFSRLFLSLSCILLACSGKCGCGLAALLQGANKSNTKTHATHTLHLTSPSNTHIPTHSHTHTHSWRLTCATHTLLLFFFRTCRKSTKNSRIFSGAAAAGQQLLWQSTLLTLLI